MGSTSSGCLYILLTGIFFSDATYGLARLFVYIQLGRSRAGPASEETLEWQLGMRRGSLVPELLGVRRPAYARKERWAGVDAQGQWSTVDDQR